jgi:hypothetical protein
VQERNSLFIIFVSKGLLGIRNIRENQKKRFLFFIFKHKTEFFKPTGYNNKKKIRKFFLHFASVHTATTHRDRERGKILD